MSSIRECKIWMKRNICWSIVSLCGAFLLVSYILIPCGNQTKTYDKNLPLIFVGGMPRSGTTLMRVLLDAHPDVRCGEETHVIPKMLGLHSYWENSDMERKRLVEAGIDDEILNSAIASFMLEIITKHGDSARHFCNKDPLTSSSSVYLKKIFPNAKFLLMIRDGRAVVNSIITRKITIKGFDLSNYRQCLTRWNEIVEGMYAQCIHVGEKHCMPVYYEQLALYPKRWMERILKFLDVPWDSSVLHHEDFIGDENKISLSKAEMSTDQVMEPVNVDALSKWVDSIPQDVVEDMERIAPMLSILGYDPNAYPPDYERPDPAVAHNTLHLQQDPEYWARKENEINRKEKQMINHPQSNQKGRKLPPGMGGPPPMMDMQRPDKYMGGPPQERMRGPPPGMDMQGPDQGPFPGMMRGPPPPGMDGEGPDQGPFPGMMRGPPPRDMDRQKRSLRKPHPGAEAMYGRN